MKEEIGHLQGIAAIVCQCCKTQLSWREINNEYDELFYSYEFDHYECSNSYKEHICDACVRQIKIDTILLS
jgi:hypothetical protein